MKQRLLTALSVAVCAVLALVALAIGVRAGWSDERDRALQASQGWAVDEGGWTLLNDYAADCANLAVVASRHLGAEDERVTALRNAAGAFAEVTDETLPALQEANEAAARAAASLSEALPALESVQASARDQVYLRTLTRVVAAPPDVLHSASRDAAERFNEQLDSALLGRLAKLMGVRPIDW